MTKRQLLLLIVSIPTIALAIWALPLVLFSLKAVTPPSAQEVHIPAGTSFAQVARNLHQQGVISDAEKFVFLGKFKEATGKIKAGIYAFSEPQRPGAVLDRLIAGKVETFRFTIPEGWTYREIAAHLERLGFADQKAFVALATDRNFLQELGITSASVEGYLFPDTYHFAKGSSEERIIRTMVRQMETLLTPELLKEASALKLNRHQLITMASIIQKETGKVSEMPLISAVIHNRIKRGMRLQMDPTVIYGIENFNGNLTRRDLRTHTPYNTYTIYGLPPGPIANPGLDALRAAVTPAKERYLYFVARGDGSHAFTTNLKAHNQAVRRYQLKR